MLIGNPALGLSASNLPAGSDHFARCAKPVQSAMPELVQPADNTSTCPVVVETQGKHAATHPSAGRLCFAADPGPLSDGRHTVPASWSAEKTGAGEQVHPGL